MADVVRHVNTDASGGAEDGTSQADGYLSLNAGLAAEAKDLVAAQDTYEIQCGASSDSADTTAVAIGAFDWNSNADYNYKITAYEGNEAVKDGWKTDRYRLEATDEDVFNFSTSDGYETIEKIQMRFVYSSSTGDNVLHLNVATAGDGAVTLDGLRIRGENADSICRGIYCGDSDLVVVIKNCIVEFCDGWLLWLADISSATVYNCVFAHQAYTTAGVDCGGNTVTIKNCAVFDTDDDFEDTGSATLDYNASDDGDGTNSVGPSGSDWDNEFNDPANGDYTALTGGNIEDAGVGPGTDSDVPSTDIDGGSRSGSTCDIGADEIAGSGVDISHTATTIEYTPGSHTYSAGASYSHTTTSIEYTPGSHTFSTGVNYSHTASSVEFTPGTHTYSTGANYNHTTTSIEYTPGSHTISAGASYSHTTTSIEYTPGSHTYSTGVNYSHTTTSIEYTPGTHSYSSGALYSHTTTSIEYTPGSHTISTGANYSHTTTSIEYTPGSHSITAGGGVDIAHTASVIEFTPGSHTISAGANYEHTTTSIEYTPGSHTISTGANYSHTTTSIEYTPGTHIYSTGANYNHTTTSIEYNPGVHTFSTGANYDHSSGSVEFTPGSHTITASTGVDISHTATSIEYTAGSHTFTAMTFHAAPVERTYTIEAESRVYKIPPESREYIIEKETREVDIR